MFTFVGHGVLGHFRQGLLEILCKNRLRGGPLDAGGPPRTSISMTSQPRKPRLRTTRGMEGPPQSFVAHVNNPKDFEGWQEDGQVLPYADAEP